MNVRIFHTNGIDRNLDGKPMSDYLYHLLNQTTKGKWRFLLKILGSFTSALLISLSMFFSLHYRGYLTPFLANSSGYIIALFVQLRVIFPHITVNHHLIRSFK